MLQQVDVGVQNPAAYEEFVGRRRERVREGFLITRPMRDEMRLLVSL